MRWGKRLGITIAACLISSVAVAEPAGNNSFVPVAIGPGSADAGSVVVEPGDHLWKISEAHVDSLLGRSAQPEEVAPYWLTVIEVNRDQLQSGDPDLIYPGEEIKLPPPP
ncbi:MAG: LysM peptidoglycan-binding domain-containing protein [Acidimicrobiia bacterium]